MVQNKNHLKLIALNISIQPVFSYLMPPKYTITGYFRHNTVKVFKNKLAKTLFCDDFFVNLRQTKNILLCL